MVEEYPDTKAVRLITAGILRALVEAGSVRTPKLEELATAEAEKVYWGTGLPYGESVDYVLDAVKDEARNDGYYTGRQNGRDEVRSECGLD